ncbi:MAG: MFS transporter, partial [Trebonia sp.]
FMLIIWLQGIWLPLHGYSYSQTPLWAGIYLVPLTVGFLLSAPLSGILSDRMGAKAFTVGGTLLAAATFLVLAFLPVNFTYWQFALIIAFNGFGTGLFASPNRAEMMNAVPADARGAAGGMIATFMNSASVLSIGIFFSLMVSGLASKLPNSLFSGLTAQGVPAASATTIAHLPPIGVLFAAFLGYNPIQTLLGPVLSHMDPAHAAFLTGRQFFPDLITEPFHSGLGLAFAFAIAACLVAAVASAMTGRVRKPGAHESLGAELAATASEGPGFEPAELVVPGDVPAANGANGSAFALAGVPHGGGRHAAPVAGTLHQAPAETAPQGVLAANGFLAAPTPSASMPSASTVPASTLSASMVSANGAGTDGLAVFGHVRHGDGAPLPGATVTLIDPAGRQAGIGRSGEDGRYQVPVPAQGNYTLIAMAKSHEPYASAVRIADRPAEVDMLLSGASRLTGTVRVAGTGQPLPGVTVTLANSRGEIVGTTVTGEGGAYDIENLVAGQYILALSAPSYQPVALPAVIADGQPSTLDAELRTGARLEGTARSKSGAVLPDVRVTLLDPDGNVAGVATTGPDGAYSFENLPEGEYTVIATGYPPAASSLKVAGGDAHSHDVELGHPEA